MEPVSKLAEYKIDFERGRLILGNQEWHIIPEKLDITPEEFFDDFGAPKWFRAMQQERAEERAMYKRNFAVMEDQIRRLRESIQQERDKLLKKLEYKELIISGAVELIEDREKVLAIVRPFVEAEHQELIDSVVDNGRFIGVGEERT